MKALFQHVKNEWLNEYLTELREHHHYSKHTEMMATRNENW